MQISRKSEYAIHSLIILAFHYGEEMSVDELAEMQDISLTYLAKVMQKLSKAGFVESSKGFKGGYRLALPPQDISLAQVVALFEKEDQFYQCMDKERDCKMGKNCIIHRVFHKAYQGMIAELEKIRIADLLFGFKAN
ncbi:hypothetical protein BBF96_10780 [Anoxybacter fermentans]|uniref:Rrf2 family transcriptional regulator n=1 Tax=Anoxybacter fermentans TaxID=1323375 RepID=A0A3Q9HR06_9FIRM|nr:Rrf2 family transcriptional regulator [Anoxybacter fermentans]AZR73828.1 hypothetical protein BBF96_10780 [Anoxybacter fermentans]